MNFSYVNSYLKSAVQMSVFCYLISRLILSFFRAIKVKCVIIWLLKETIKETMVYYSVLRIIAHKNQLEVL